MAIDLELDEQQQLLQSTARAFFAEHCPLARVRALEASEAGYCPELWRRMAELDWLGLSFPERYGGAGGGLLELYALYLEMGRAIVPTPHLTSSVLCGEAILRGGDEALCQRWLPALARGERIVSLAWLEPSGAYDPRAVELTASPRGAGWRLDGTKLLVPYAHVADALLVVARTGSGPRDLGLWLVERGARGLALERLENIAGAPLYAATFEGVEVSGAARVGPPGRGWDLLAPILERAAVLQCAEIAGAGERVLQLAVRHALDRVQFGQPVGRFQAVQNLCADVAIGAHLTSLLSRQAAWRIDVGEPAAREVAIAKAYASHAAQHMLHQAQEVQAGHGFMLENDLQLFLRRAKHWELNLGDARFHREAIASALEQPGA